MILKMTSKEQRKLKKKKAREKDVKKKVLARREQLRAPAREERADRRRDKRHDKFIKEMDSFQFYTEEQLAALDEDTLTQLEKNCKVLRGLEFEHEKEVGSKRKLNLELEEQGYTTLQEKLKAVSEEQIREQKAQVGMGGSADCKMAPVRVKRRRSPIDTAEVALVKAKVSSDVKDSSDIALAKAVEENS